MLLGNAAHTLHPIAAQGFNLALYEVALLAQAIVDNPHTVLTMADLQPINARFLQQQRVSMGVSHRLPQLLAQPSSLLSLCLPWGMLGLEVATPLKRHFMQRMLGQTYG